MSKNHERGALDEFLERQDLAQNPANFKNGNFRAAAPIPLGKDPVFRLVIGAIFAVVAAALLFIVLIGNWFILLFVACFAALSVMNVVEGIRTWPERRRKKHKAHKKK